MRSPFFCHDRHVTGHSIFTEDGVETHNVVQNNLVAITQRSMSLLLTDQTPASYWVVNPYNIYRNNVAAGSSDQGYWFKLLPGPTGSQSLAAGPR